MNNDAIVLGLVSRNSNAIGAFWSTYYNRVYPICAYILESDSDAHDMTVDILLDFIDNRAQRLSSPKAMYTFLRLTAVRRCIRFRDRQNRNAPLNPDNHTSGESSPETDAEFNLLMPHLNQCLGELTPKTQAALRLKYAKKISNEQIGDIVGGSKSYIGRLLKRGLAQLRQCVEKKVRQAAAKKRDTLGVNASPIRLVTSPTIEDLLARRIMPQDTQCACFAEYIENGAIDKADSHLQHCALCRKTLLYLHRLNELNEERHALPGPTCSVWSVKTKSKPPWKALFVAAAAMFVLSMGYILISPSGKPGSLPGQMPDSPAQMPDSPAQMPDSPAQTPDSYRPLQPKGRGDRLFVAIERGASRFTARPQDNLISGDRIGFFYSADMAGYLSVFSVDSNGRVSLLHPSTGKASVPIVAGDRVALRDGAVADEGTGCEWVVAVFSTAPLETDVVKHAVSASRHNAQGDSCQLKTDVPGARTVVIFPFTRNVSGP